MGRYLGEIAWETEVWVADAPSHLIHFNGVRFLGPYDVRMETMIEAELRHQNLQKTPSTERLQQVARADLQDFNYLAGKPERLDVALTMQPLIDNPDYRATVLPDAPNSN